ncbi:MAG TPA: hypothetical protein VJT68_03365 [Thermoleophilaceae bacterium]|nr:hypothetical protein [Thermoleophilaceae bacterium]
MRDRIMYVEARRPDGGVRFARIARVRFSKSGRSIHFEGREFLGVGRGEYREVESGETWWFSGPRRDGNDRGGNRPGSFPIESTRTFGASTGRTYAACRSAPRSR